MSYTADNELQDARELDQVDHGLRSSCYWSAGRNICELLATPESAEAFTRGLAESRQARRNLRRECNRREPIADRVSARGFRIGDRVRIRGQEGVVTVCDIGVMLYPGCNSQTVNVTGRTNTGKMRHFYDDPFSDWWLELVEPRQCKYDLQRAGVAL